MTASEIRNDYKSFMNEMEGLNKQILQAAKKGATPELARLTVEFQATMQSKTLETWTEIAAQLAESNQMKREHFEETKKLCAELIAAYKATIGQDASCRI